MRKSALIATFASLVLAFFVCGCEKENSDTENYDKNISTKVISKNSEKNQFHPQTFSKAPPIFSH